MCATGRMGCAWVCSDCHRRCLMKYLNFLLIESFCGSDPNGHTTEGVTDMVTSTVMPDMTASTVSPPATPDMSPEDA